MRSGGTNFTELQNTLKMECVFLILVILSFGHIYTAATSPRRHSELMGKREMTFSGKCNMMHPCSQLCVDLPYMFSFKCACYEGKVLAKNGFLCVDPGAEDETDKDMGPDLGEISEEIKAKPTKFSAQNLQGSIDWEGDITNYEMSGSGSGGGVDEYNMSDDEDYSYVYGSGNDDIYFTQDMESTPFVTESFGIFTPTQTPELKYFTDSTTESENLISTKGALTQSTQASVIHETTTTAETKSCDEITCHNGGSCELDRRESAHCLCPLGYYGESCEEGIEVLYPSFKGYGYMALPTPSGIYHGFEIRIDFKPTHPDGLLLFSSERNVNGGVGDFFSVALSNGIVQFRFNCGSGTGLIQSKSAVTMDTWHVVKIQREDLTGSLKVDEEESVHGRSKGTYTKLSLRQPLYLGGHPKLANLHSKTAVNTGFEGCVERLVINGKNIDLRPAPKGAAEMGVNVGECTLPLCQESPCLHGGTCSLIRPDRHVCLCPLGRYGESCQEEILVDIPSFSGTSYIAHNSLSNQHLSFIEVEIVFRPRKPNGVIIYSGLNIDGTGDFISLTLTDGHIEFRFDCGSGPAILRSKLPIEMNVWHAVSAARTAREGILRVNDHDPVQGFSKGGFSQISFKTDFYIGGVHNYDELPRNAEISSSFVGDIQRVVVSDQPLDLIGQALRGVNVANANHPCAGEPCYNGGECEPLHDSFMCHCKLGFSGPNCQDEVSLPIGSPQFLFKSYIRYTGPWVMNRISGLETHLKIQFRTLGSEGLLLWAGHSNHSRHNKDFIALSLHEGILKFSFNLGHGITILTSKTTVNDGRWHKVELNRVRANAKMELDDTEVITKTASGSMSSLDINDGLYLGGVKDIITTTRKRFSLGIAGCIRDITIDGELLSLFEEPSDGRNVIPCVQDIVGREADIMQGYG